MNIMATAKTAKKAATKKVAVKSAPVKKAAAKKAVTKVAAKKAATAPKNAPQAAKASPKPIKVALNKTGLLAHLAEQTGIEPKAVKAVLAALESTMVASIAKKGAGTFLMPGLFKVTATQVPAKKARKGIDPFTKQERVFAAKPATVRVSVRALKKLKDAAL